MQDQQNNPLFGGMSHLGPLEGTSKHQRPECCYLELASEEQTEHLEITWSQPHDCIQMVPGSKFAFLVEITL